MVTYDRHRERIVNTSSLLEGHSIITSSKEEKMYDCLIDNFHSRSAKGEIFNNPMSKHSVVEEKPFWGSRVTGFSMYGDPIDTTYWSPVYADFLPTPSEAYADIGTVQDLALTQAHAGVGADQIDLLTSIAELNESVKTIVNVGVKTAKVMRKLRKFNLKAIAKGFNLRDVREQYLEFRYGLRPMYYDLKGVHDYLKSEISYDRHTSRGYSADIVDVSNDIITTKKTSLWPWSTRPAAIINFARKTYVKSSSRAGVLFAAQFTDNLSKVIAELGVDRPISSVWELVPFSFMIDWFANVGDTIRAWEPKPHCSSLASWSVNCIEQISEVKPISIVFVDIAYGAVVHTSTLTFPQTAVRRTVSLSRIPNPRLAILPSIDINLSTSKLLDMAAIFSGLAESKRRQGW